MTITDRLTLMWLHVSSEEPPRDNTVSNTHRRLTGYRILIRKNSVSMNSFSPSFFLPRAPNLSISHRLIKITLLCQNNKQRALNIARILRSNHYSSDLNDRSLRLCCSLFELTAFRQTDEHSKDTHSTYGTIEHINVWSSLQTSWKKPNKIS